MAYQKYIDGISLRPIVNTFGSPTYDLAKFVAKILGPLVGHSNYFIKDSNEFVSTIKNKTIVPCDICISFNLVSLFTKTPLNEVVLVVKKVTHPETNRLA
jgi:hypothetical protein